jgi:hypothetical protein
MNRNLGSNILIDLCVLIGHLVVFVLVLGFNWIQCAFLCMPYPYLTFYVGRTVKCRSLLLSIILILFGHSVVESVIEVRPFTVDEKGREQEG